MEMKELVKDGPIVGLESIKRVLVVGAGVAGLQTARALLRSGFSVAVLEEGEDVGGVWLANHEGYALQVPWSVYTFPDFPYPKELEPANEYPTGKEVHNYVAAYARKFDLYRHIRLNSKLISLFQQQPAEGDKPPTWAAHYLDKDSGKQFVLTANFVVLCTGLFSTPFIPTVQGLQRFQGRYLHSKEAANVADIARGKRVLVVGSGKTGWDLVSEIGMSKVAESVTILYRTSHWTLPRMIGRREDVVKFLYSRRTLGMLPPFYTAGPAARMVHAVLKPVKTLFWNRITKASRKAFGVPKMPKPDAPLEDDLFNGGQIYDEQWTRFMEDPAVRTLQGSIASVLPNGVELTDGSKLDCDVILFCTGYYNNYKFLSGEVRSALRVQQDGLYLYRNVLPPGVTNLAFVGGEVSTFNNLLTSALQAEWLARALTGHIELPSRSDMEGDVEELKGWRRTTMPPARNRASVYMLYQQAYHDQLLRDMHEQAYRKPHLTAPLAECFAPYLPSDYSEVVAPRTYSSFTALGTSCRGKSSRRAAAFGLSGTSQAHVHAKLLLCKDSASDVAGRGSSVATQASSSVNDSGDSAARTSNVTLDTDSDLPRPLPPASSRTSAEAQVQVIRTPGTGTGGSSKGGGVATATVTGTHAHARGLHLTPLDLSGAELPPGLLHGSAGIKQEHGHPSSPWNTPKSPFSDHDLSLTQLKELVPRVQNMSNKEAARALGMETSGSQVHAPTISTSELELDDPALVGFESVGVSCSLQCSKDGGVRGISLPGGPVVITTGPGPIAEGNEQDCQAKDPARLKVPDALGMALGLGAGTAAGPGSPSAAPMPGSLQLWCAAAPVTAASAAAAGEAAATKVIAAAAGPSRPMGSAGGAGSSGLAALAAGRGSNKQTAMEMDDVLKEGAAAPIPNAGSHEASYTNADLRSPAQSSNGSTPNTSRSGTPRGRNRRSHDLPTNRRRSLETAANYQRRSADMPQSSRDHHDPTVPAYMPPLPGQVQPIASNAQPGLPGQGGDNQFMMRQWVSHVGPDHDTGSHVMGGPGQESMSSAALGSSAVVTIGSLLAPGSHAHLHHGLRQEEVSMEHVHSISPPGAHQPRIGTLGEDKAAPGHLLRAEDGEAAVHGGLHVRTHADHSGELVLANGLHRPAASAPPHHPHLQPHSSAALPPLPPMAGHHAAAHHAAHPSPQAHHLEGFVHAREDMVYLNRSSRSLPAPMHVVMEEADEGHSSGSAGQTASMGALGSGQAASGSAGSDGKHQTLAIVSLGGQVTEQQLHSCAGAASGGVAAAPPVGEHRRAPSPDGLQALAAAVAQEAAHSGSLFTFHVNPVRAKTSSTGRMGSHNYPMRAGSGMAQAFLSGEYAAAADSSTSNVLRRLSGRCATTNSARASSALEASGSNQAAPGTSSNGGAADGEGRTSKPRHHLSFDGTNGDGAAQPDSARSYDVAGASGRVLPYEPLLAVLLSSHHDAEVAAAAGAMHRGRADGSAQQLVRLSGRIAPSVHVSSSLPRLGAGLSEMSASQRNNVLDAAMERVGSPSLPGSTSAGSSTGAAPSTSPAAAAPVPAADEEMLSMYLHLLQDLGVMPDRLVALLQGGQAQQQQAVSPTPARSRHSHMLLSGDIRGGSAGGGSMPSTPAHLNVMRRLSGRVLPSGSCAVAGSGAAVDTGLLAADDGEMVADLATLEAQQQLLQQQQAAEAAQEEAGGQYGAFSSQLFVQALQSDLAKLPDRLREHLRAVQSQTQQPGAPWELASAQLASAQLTPHAGRSRMMFTRQDQQPLPSQVVSPFASTAGLAGLMTVGGGPVSGDATADAGMEDLHSTPASAPTSYVAAAATASNRNASGGTASAAAAMVPLVAPAGADATLALLAQVQEDLANLPARLVAALARDWSPHAGDASSVQHMWSSCSNVLGGTPMAEPDGTYFDQAANPGDAMGGAAAGMSTRGSCGVLRRLDGRVAPSGAATPRCPALPPMAASPMSSVVRPGAESSGPSAEQAAGAAAGAVAEPDPAALLQAVQEDLARLPERLAVLHRGLAHRRLMSSGLLSSTDMGSTPMPSDHVLLKLEGRVMPSFSAGHGSQGGLSGAASARTLSGPPPAGLMGIAQPGAESRSDLEDLLALVQDDLARLPDRLAGHGIVHHSVSQPSRLSPRPTCQHRSELPPSASASQPNLAALHRLQGRIVPSGTATPAYGTRAVDMSGPNALPATPLVAAQLQEQLHRLLLFMQQDANRLVDRLEAAAWSCEEGAESTMSSATHVSVDGPGQHSQLKRLQGRVAPSFTGPQGAAAVTAAGIESANSSGTGKPAGSALHMLDTQTIQQLLLGDLLRLPERLAASGVSAQAPAGQSGLLLAWARGSNSNAGQDSGLDSTRLFERADARSFSSVATNVVAPPTGASAAKRGAAGSKGSTWTVDAVMMDKLTAAMDETSVGGWKKDSSSQTKVGAGGAPSVPVRHHSVPRPRSLATAQPHANTSEGAPGCGGLPAGMVQARASEPSYVMNGVNTRGADSRWSGYQEAALFQLTGRARRMSGPSCLGRPTADAEGSSAADSGSSNAAMSAWAQQMRVLGSFSATESGANSMTETHMSGFASQHLFERLSGRIMPSNTMLTLLPGTACAGAARSEAPTLATSKSAGAASSGHPSLLLATINGGSAGMHRVPDATDSDRSQQQQNAAESAATAAAPGNGGSGGRRALIQLDAAGEMGIMYGNDGGMVESGYGRGSTSGTGDAPARRPGCIGLRPVSQDLIRVGQSGAFCTGTVYTGGQPDTDDEYVRRAPHSSQLVDAGAVAFGALHMGGAAAMGCAGSGARQDLPPGVVVLHALRPSPSDLAGTAGTSGQSSLKAGTPALTTAPASAAANSGEVEDEEDETFFTAGEGSMQSGSLGAATSGLSTAAEGSSHHGHMGGYLTPHRARPSTGSASSNAGSAGATGGSTPKAAPGSRANSGSNPRLPQCTLLATGSTEAAAATTAARPSSEAPSTHDVEAHGPVVSVVPLMGGGAGTGSTAAGTMQALQTHDSQVTAMLSSTHATNSTATHVHEDHLLRLSGRLIPSEALSNIMVAGGHRAHMQFQTQLSQELQHVGSAVSDAQSSTPDTPDTPPHAHRQRSLGSTNNTHEGPSQKTSGGVEEAEVGMPTLQTLAAQHVVTAPAPSTGIKALGARPTALPGSTGLRDLPTELLNAFGSAFEAERSVGASPARTLHNVPVYAVLPPQHAAVLATASEPGGMSLCSESDSMCTSGMHTGSMFSLRRLSGRLMDEGSPFFTVHPHPASAAQLSIPSSPTKDQAAARSAPSSSRAVKSSPAVPAFKGLTEEARTEPFQGVALAGYSAVAVESGSDGLPQTGTTASTSAGAGDSLSAVTGSDAQLKRNSSGAATAAAVSTQVVSVDGDTTSLAQLLLPTQFGEEVMRLTPVLSPGVAALAPAPSTAGPVTRAPAAPKHAHKPQAHTMLPRAMAELLNMPEASLGLAMGGPTALSPFSSDAVNTGNAAGFSPLNTGGANMSQASRLNSPSAAVRTLGSLGAGPSNAGGAAGGSNHGSQGTSPMAVGASGKLSQAERISAAARAAQLHSDIHGSWASQ